MYRVRPLNDLPPGVSIRLESQPPIAVFRTEEDGLFAIDDTCTYQDASLTVDVHV